MGKAICWFIEKHWANYAVSCEGGKVSCFPMLGWGTNDCNGDLKYKWKEWEDYYNFHWPDDYLPGRAAYEVLKNILKGN